MKNKIIQVVFLIISTNLFGQYSYYQKAIITKNDSDKLNGYVKRIAESDISLDIIFKYSLEDKESVKYTVNEIEQLEFVDDSTFFNKIKYIHFIDTNRVVEYRLAKKLLEGYAELYKLQLPENEQNIIFELTNTFVYILKIDTNYYLLDQKEIIKEYDDEHYYKLNKNYQGVLLHIFKDHKKFENKIKNLPFSDRHIVPLISEFNVEHSQTPSGVIKTKEKVLFYHSLEIRYVLLNNYDLIKGSGVTLGYLGSIKNPEISEKISSSIGIFPIYSGYTYEITGYKSSEWLLNIPITLNYQFMKSIISPYIFGGISINVQRGNRIELLNSGIFYSATTEAVFCAIAGAGLNFYKHFQISYAIESLNFKINSPRIMFFTIAYRFGS